MEIVKISKYITVNSSGIAQIVGFFFLSLKDPQQKSTTEVFCRRKIDDYIRQHEKLKWPQKSRQHPKFRRPQKWSQTQKWKWHKRGRQPHKWRQPLKWRWPQKWRQPQSNFGLCSADVDCTTSL